AVAPHTEPAAPRVGAGLSTERAVSLAIALGAVEHNGRDVVASDVRGCRSSVQSSRGWLRRRVPATNSVLSSFQDSDARAPASQYDRGFRGFDDRTSEEEGGALRPGQAGLDETRADRGPVGARGTA